MRTTAASVATGSGELSRRYDEEITVHFDEPEREGAAAPSLFLWRGRVHLVREVLGHWRARTPWWRDVLDARADEAVLLEQDLWRVAASPGRDFAAGVYDLVCVPVGEVGQWQWRLARVSD